MSDVEANVEAQRALYGDALGSILRRCGSVLGASQARLAELLGISAPMLSQLMSGRRVKIGNPAAVHRLQVLLEVVDGVEDGTLDVEAALARVRGTGGSDVLTMTSRRPDARGRALEVQAMFRRVAGAAHYLDAADAVASTHPAVAELLRVYGAGSEAEAIEHFTQRT